MSFKDYAMKNSVSDFTNRAWPWHRSMHHCLSRPFPNVRHENIPQWTEGYQRLLWQLLSEHTWQNFSLLGQRVMGHRKTIMACATENLVLLKPCPEREVFCIAPLAIPNIVISQRHYIRHIFSFMPFCRNFAPTTVTIVFICRSYDHLSHTQVTDMLWNRKKHVNKYGAIYLECFSLASECSYLDAIR